uniref:Uncharacterized protein n=1 Tax=Romanomermis culicivorax TaxID=13658 RepID=A0A915IL51_ROMCU
MLTACVIGDHSHVTLGVSAIMDINGAVILLNAANITLDRLSNMVLEPNSSLATALPKPLLFIGEQARLTVQRGTHCLLIDDVVIPPRTTWTLAPETIDERIKYSLS